jgi:hypothetical protein
MIMYPTAMILGTPKNEGDKSDGSSTSTSASSSHRGSETSTPSGSPQPSSKRNDHTPRFYVMKCTQQKTLDTSVSNGTWYLTANSAKKLNKTFQVRY